MIQQKPEQMQEISNIWITGFLKWLRMISAGKSYRRVPLDLGFSGVQSNTPTLSYSDMLVKRIFEFTY